MIELPPNIELYGFSGKLGSGKNFIAEKVFKEMFYDVPTLIMAFADQFKIDCIVLDNINREEIFHKKTETSRKMLQKRGTEEGREKYGEDIWVN